MSNFGNGWIDVRYLDDLVRQRGEWCKLYQGARCPCGVDPSQANFSCPNCRGLGYFYPNPPLDVCGIVSDIHLNRDLMGIPGFAMPGDLSFTMRPLRGPLTELYDFDKITLTYQDGFPIDGETVIASPAGSDYLLHSPVKVLHVYGTNPLDTTSTVKIVEFIQGTDFSLSGNLLTWLGAHRPAAGTIYTVRYTAQPTWIVFQPPRLHIERGTSYGQSCLLRKVTAIMNRAPQGLG